MLAHLPLNIILVIPIIPVVVFGLLVKGRSARWPMSLLLWSITVGHNEAKLQELQTIFVTGFRQRIRCLPQVLAHFNYYLAKYNFQVWLITGSSEPLVQKVYNDAFFLTKVQLIGSHMHRICDAAREQIGNLLTIV